VSAVPEASTKFRSAILCEDIRDEVGAKHSLMGVLSGDIIVPSLPATIQIAFFAQYHLSEGEDHQIKVLLRLMIDDTEIAHATLEANVPAHAPVATLVLPKGLASFEKESTFQILASIRGGPEEVLVTKKLILVKQPSA
jgi:hypothetical protein